MAEDAARGRTAQSDPATAPAEAATPAGTAPTNGSVPAEAPRLLVEGEIGAGAMGVVLAVRDEVLRRDLAMKRVRTDSGEVEPVTREVLSSPSHAPLLVRRLVEEAQVTAQLDHPGVVPVHELGVDDQGRAYFTMKRVHGRTLEAVMREGREKGTFPLGRALQVFLRICDALAYAHGKGVVHRDVKPGNVMVGRYGEVYLMDWGLAKVREDAGAVPPAAPAVPAKSIVHTLQSDLLRAGGDSPMTMDGQLIGTIGYMAPEQVGGGAIDERADVYAVGAMLYELLAGHAPFTGPDAPPDMSTLIARLFGGEPAPLEERAPHAPPELVSISKKAMARDRALRFASAHELADELHAFLDGRVVRSHRTGVWVEIRSWARRNRWLAAGIAAGVLVAAGAVAAFVAQQRAAATAIGRERDAAVAARGRAEEAQKRSDGLRLAAQSATVIERDPGLALAMAVDAAAAAPGPETSTALYRVLRTHRERLYLAGHEGYVNSARFFGRGRRLVSTDESGSTIVWDLAAGRGERWIDAPGGAIQDSALLADERTFAAAQADGRVRVWDLETGALRRTIDTGPLWPVREPGAEKEPDSPVLAAGAAGALLVADAGGAVRRFDLETGAATPVATHEGRAWLGTGLPAGSAHVLTLGADDVLMLDARRVTDPAGARVARPDGCWARGSEPAGRAFARFASGSWRLVSLETGADVTTAPAGAELVGDAAFSADGRRLFVLFRGPAAIRLEVRDAADGALIRAFPCPNKTLWPSPDGSLVAFAGALETEVYDAETGLERCRLRGHRYHVRAAAWSPDGRSLATAAHDASVRVWDVRRESEREGVVARARRGDRVLGWSDDAAFALVAPPSGAVRAVEAVDAESGSVRARFEVPEASVDTVLLDRAGTHAWWTEGTTVRAYDLARRVAEPPLRLAWPADAPAPGRASPSPDGRRVLVQGGDPRLLFDAASGALVARLGVDTTYNRSAWSADGGRIALSYGQRGDAGVYDGTTGAFLHGVRGHTGYLLSLAFDPSGSRLVTGAMDATVRVSAADTGRLLGRVVGFPLRDLDVAFGPDGRVLAVESADLMMFDASRPGDPVELASLVRAADQRELRLHPDGRRFWTRDDEQRVRLWDLDARAQGEAVLSRPVLPLDRVGFDRARALAGAVPSSKFFARSDPWWDTTRASLLLPEGRADEALAAADAAIARRPRWARPSLLRARALALLATKARDPAARERRLEEVRAEFRRLVSLEPPDHLRGAGSAPPPELQPFLSDPALRALMKSLDMDLGD